MEDIVLEEIVKDCNWYEKIIVKIFRKLFIRVYHNIRIRLINNMIK